MKHIQDMLAACFFAFAGKDAHWTCTARKVGDSNCVDVALGPGDFERLTRTVGVMSVAVVLHGTFAIDDEHAFLLCFLQGIDVLGARFIDVAVAALVDVDKVCAETTYALRRVSV